jgi:predicted NBD/HSP70 family sugar kinase
MLNHGGFLAPHRAKEMQVLALVDEGGALTRRALAEATGLRPANLNRLVAGMIERGVLHDVQADTTGRRGRPSSRVALRPEAGFVVGLEFGREHLTAVAVDAAGQLRHVVETLPAPDFEPSGRTMDALAAAVAETATRAGLRRERIRAVGVALHDVVTADGEWRIAGRSAAAAIDARTELTARLGVPVLVDDVSRAFAEAEFRFGAGMGERDTVYVFLGNHGVGGGAFVNGRMLVSSSGICGELGHVVVQEDGPLCQCGSHGCFETVASHSAALQRFETLAAAGVATSLAPPVRFPDICQAAGAGDKAAYLVLRELGQALGRALGAAVNLLGTPTIIVGGSLRLAGAAFLETVAATLRERVVSELSPALSVRYASLPPHAGAWGVAVEARSAALREGTFLETTAPIGAR